MRQAHRKHTFWVHTQLREEGREKENRVRDLDPRISKRREEGDEEKKNVPRLAYGAKGQKKGEGI